MKRLIATLLLFAAVAFGFADAKPARPLFEPEVPPKMAAPVVVNLAGTTWLGKYGVTDRYFAFEADGTVSYWTAAKTKMYKLRGNWKSDGVNFFFDHHTGTKKISLEFRGVIKDADTIVGEQTLVLTGAKSPVTMKKAPPIK